MKVLLIEDDKDLCQALSFTLKQNGYIVDTCLRGDEAIYYGSSASYDVIILDRMLPYLDGLTILQVLRKNNITTPIILVTAMNGINDRIDGLDAGADDYLVKPFDTGELLARIRALSRRPRTIESNTILKFSNFSLDTELHTLTAESKTVTLSNKETCLLEYLIRNRGQILTREQILTRVWGLDSVVEDGNLDNYIYFVRRRLKTVNCKARIKTIHSVGYQLEEI
ncbi:response regulator transcription factor [Mobilitalea sibirica]|uniref:Stage 0 sporulation protein A homolog n=1 Tax=Mobilitalea sibirica TaxID=1462919 RepID=A0A8J7H0Y6_9FIRM|nr:response regulator transcription factor [Mobilitalea sibirica]MBH1939600.1 response regulator transcription factor [Mobilitalea sibirica]